MNIWNVSINFIYVCIESKNSYAITLCTLYSQGRIQGGHSPPPLDALNFGEKVEKNFRNSGSPP